MRWTLLVSLAAVAAWVGCGGYEPAPMAPKAPPQPAAAQTPAPKPQPQQPAPQSGMTAGMQGIGTAIGMAPIDTAVSGPMGVAPASPPSAPPPPPAVKAQAGVGAKGRGYGPGIITTPVATYFRARERIVFEIEIPNNMKLYKALNGSAPKTHEEFMEKIIKANGTRLPELPPGHQYKYFPDKEELMIEQPAQ